MKPLRLGCLGVLGFSGLILIFAVFTGTDTQVDQSYRSSAGSIKATKPTRANTQTIVTATASNVKSTPVSLSKRSTVNRMTANITTAVTHPPTATTTAKSPKVNKVNKVIVPFRYKNCTDVWNKLGRPIHRGDPGYAAKLDQDGDGTGCEQRPKK